ncbi:helix-turn-helix transcriptional regulator [Rhizobium halophytocola]|uniref:LuxR family quorum-sensing system transcriptional regulator SinR n=1 Tax=Rhizobium halophytocola TaxID=735519 RepID=A0ABS4DZ65_9HYPH|nr:helix-turn-helix domain-containing protein [Rhizobium halophytocola]MBP1850980.1 LuxR family quorum-sensing system transcriptional regulator SinR [Rhizobium halophytocola]
MKRTFGLAHVLYVDAGPAMYDGAGLTVHCLHHTLDARAVAALSLLGTSPLHDVLKAAMAGVKPIDWATLQNKHSSAATLGAMAHRLDLRQAGACYPLASRNGRTAILAVNMDADARAWSQFRRLHDRDLHTLGVYFHAAMLDRRPPLVSVAASDTSDNPALTRRELETLRWAAAGKSYWEIAKILGITERTVRFFMSNARRKLNVVTNTQAVAEAYCHGLLSQ